MKWPVPNSYVKELPQTGTVGGFWENRCDRFHCGVDIYAPCGSEIFCPQDGTVVAVGEFTSAHKVDYWNSTYYIVVQHVSGIVVKYAELETLAVELKKTVHKGERLGTVGRVLNVNRITDNAPEYIQALKTKKIDSMLHLECYSEFPVDMPGYSGGNLFQNQRPSFLLDPVDFF